MRPAHFLRAPAHHMGRARAPCGNNSSKICNHHRKIQRTVEDRAFPGFVEARVTNSRAQQANFGLNFLPRQRCEIAIKQLTVLLPFYKLIIGLGESSGGISELTLSLRVVFFAHPQ
jgi:hypothetical protein